MASGLVLPGALVTLLNDLGYLWPDADEVRLGQIGQAWIELQGSLNPIAEAADTTASGVWGTNAGTDIDAFKAAWTKSEGPSDTLHSNATGTVVVGAVVIVGAVVVLALKVWVIAQLVMLAIAIAQAIATAPVTFGASLLEIPVIKEIVGRLINLLISQAMEVLLG